MPQVASTFPCSGCGAELEFKPGSRSLTCQFCGGRNEIPAPAEDVQEQDFDAMVATLEEGADHQESFQVHCDSCGADVPMAANVTSQACPFCGSNIVATGTSKKLIKPKAVLPFAIDREKARTMFNDWLKGLWFAPSDLKRYASIEGSATTSARGAGLSGMYLPYWTFDAKAVTPYTGQRGDYYYVTVPYNTTVNGKTVTRMRQERRIRWSWASGTVHDAFDDVQVPGSRSIPAEKLAGLGGWDTKNVVPYSDAYLAGFKAESYTIGLKDGFVAAQRAFEQEIQRSIRHDIGGDEQRIASMSPTYSDVTFKHILAPLWVSAFRYRDKVYRFLVNGRTGQVSGERPYSAAKIALAVLAGLVVVGIIAFLASR